MNRLLPILMVLVGLALAVGSMASAAQAQDALSLDDQLTLSAFDRDAAMPILTAHAPRPVAFFSCARFSPEDGTPSKGCQLEPVFTTAIEAGVGWPPSVPVAFIASITETAGTVRLRPRPPKAG